MSSLSKEQERYVEDFGLFFEPYGSRIMGRVLGVLFISDPPERSAEELINLLKSSQGSISQATRALERLGWIQRLTRPGDRRAYFRVRPGAWQETARQSILGIARFREMAERALDLQDSKDPEARRALEKMRDFYVYWEKETIALLERWNGGQEGRA